MTDRILNCKSCGIHVVTIRDGKVKKGMVTYCSECDATRNWIIELNKPKKSPDMPDCFKDLFGDK